MKSSGNPTLHLRSLYEALDLKSKRDCFHSAAYIAKFRHLPQEAYSIVDRATACGSGVLCSVPGRYICSKDFSRKKSVNRAPSEKILTFAENWQL